jgi:coenzyme PQQ precursor peptide PqqA
MNWTTPDFDEIAVSCEINSYALAEAASGVIVYNNIAVL